MSESISHECGVALVRLLKPLSYYQEKYGTPLWGFTKLFLLMEKQHNRGQDGAGVACVKLDVPRRRAVHVPRAQRQVQPARPDLQDAARPVQREGRRSGVIHPEFPDTVKRHFDFGGELLLGHLRYGTSGGYNLSACHPVFQAQPLGRRATWRCAGTST